MFSNHDFSNREKSRESLTAAAHVGGRSPYAASLKDNRPSSIMQRKLMNQQAASHSTGPVVQAKSNSTGLPDNLKSGIENLSGHSMDDVKVHYNSSQPAQLNAHAYAQGNQIHLASGQEKHLPHEAWHVVQQKQGRVKATMQLKGKVNVNDDTGLEKEADVMGAKAMSHTSSKHPMQLKFVQGFMGGIVMQRTVDHDNPQFAPKNNRAGAVLVENIRGAPLGPGANAPVVDIFGWPQLLASGDTLANPHSTHYNAVRMHLWNGRLGGPGNNADNLAPGPAQINSSMSAGPETASKDAVSSGHYIWLHTEVWYQNNSGNALDYTSVVPNRMRMEWGLMEAAGGVPASLFRPAIRRGPAQPPAWDVQIDQPGGAMLPARKQQYDDVNSMAAAGQVAALDALLHGTSDQEKVQAYAIVTGVGNYLKKHMLLTQPVIYMGMDDASKAAALAALTVAETQTLAGILGLGGNREIYNEIMVHMLAAPAILQAYFATFAAQDQIAIILYAGAPVLGPLDAIALAFARTRKAVFTLYPVASQYNILDAMSAAQISVLLHGAIDTGLFDRWAMSHGHAQPNAMAAYIGPRVTDAMRRSYDAQMAWRARQQQARQNPHPVRNRHLTAARYEPY